MKRITDKDEEEEEDGEGEEKRMGKIIMDNTKLEYSNKHS